VFLFLLKINVQNYKYDAFLVVKLRLVLLSILHGWEVACISETEVGCCQQLVQWKWYPVGLLLV